MDIDALLRRIDERLKKTGKSPRAVSLEAGMNADAIRNIQRGKSKNPQWHTLEKLAEVLGCDVNWLAYGTTETDLAPRSEDEIELLIRYRSMTKQQKAGALGMVRLVDSTDTRKTKE